MVVAGALLVAVVVAVGMVTVGVVVALIVPMVVMVIVVAAMAVAVAVAMAMGVMGAVGMVVRVVMPGMAVVCMTMLMAVTVLVVMLVGHSIDPDLAGGTTADGTHGDLLVLFCSRRRAPVDWLLRDRCTGCTPRQNAGADSIQRHQASSNSRTRISWPAVGWTWWRPHSGHGS